MRLCWKLSSDEDGSPVLLFLKRVLLLLGRLGLGLGFRLEELNISLSFSRVDVGPVTLLLRVEARRLDGFKAAMESFGSV